VRPTDLNAIQWLAMARATASGIADRIRAALQA